MWSETCLKSLTHLIKSNVREKIRSVQVSLTAFFFTKSWNWNDDERKLCISMQFMLTACRLSNNLKWVVVHWTEVHWFCIWFYPHIAHTYIYIQNKRPLETNQRIHTRNLTFLCMWCDQSTHWTATDMKHPHRKFSIKIVEIFVMWTNFWNLAKFGERKELKREWKMKLVQQKKMPIQQISIKI